MGCYVQNDGWPCAAHTGGCYVGYLHSGAVEPQIIQSDFPYFANLFMLSPRSASRHIDAQN